MANELKTFNFTFSMRNAPKSGPSSSDAWNDSFTELSTDLANIALEWNTKLVSIIEGLPSGSVDTSINAFVNGLDGKNIWVDQDASSLSDDSTFYDAANDRPITIEEALVNVYQYVNDQLTQLLDNVIDQATGLTTAQKTAIGDHIFDSTKLSSATSLDGKSENNRLNILQIAQDLYGPTYALGNDGSTDLANSLFAMVDALLELHNGNWDNDTTLDHTGAFGAVAQTAVNTSVVVDDSFVGAPSNLEEDLNQIRTRIKNLGGTVNWQSAFSSLYAGGPDSLETLLSFPGCSGVKQALNPWGYRYDDIDGLLAILVALRDFTGQNSHLDATTDYSSIYYIDDGDSLETAIGKLDAESERQSGLIIDHLNQLAALETFVGQNSNTDSTPDYSSTVYLTQNDPLETAIGKLDAQMSLFDVGHDGYLTRDGLRPMSGVLNMGGNDIQHVEDLEVGSTILASGNIVSEATSSGIVVHGVTRVTSSGDMRCETTIEAGQDIEVTANGYGIILHSPDGTRWRLEINNLGAPTTAAI